MGREAKAKAARRDPLGKLVERGLRVLELRCQDVKLAMNRPDFKEAIDTRAHLLIGTPGEITSNEMVAELGRQLLTERGIDTTDVSITTLLRHQRLQVFVDINSAARGRIVDEARRKLALRALTGDNHITGGATP